MTDLLRACVCPTLPEEGSSKTISTDSRLRNVWESSWKQISAICLETFSKLCWRDTMQRVANTGLAGDAIYHHISVTQQSCKGSFSFSSKSLPRSK